MISFELKDQLDNDKLESLQYDYKIDLALSQLITRKGLSINDILTLAYRYGKRSTR